MKICVTGGAGFIGAELVRLLNKKGYEDIVIVDRPSLFRNKDLVFTQFVNCDAVLENGNFDFLSGVDFCFHLGANSSTRASFVEVNLQNIDFSRNLIEYCKHNGIYVVFASSGAIYGSSREKNSSPDPLTFYGQSKLSTEKFVAESKSDNVVCLRYHNVYGPSEEHKGNMSSIISKWMADFLSKKGDNVLFEGSDRILRDFIHVDDINSVNVFFLDYYLKYKAFPTQQVFDVGTGVAVSFQQVADEIVKHTKVQYNYVPNPYNETNYQFHTKASIEKLAELFQDLYGNPYLPLTISEGVESVFQKKMKGVK
jgi:ADP-L-glycero-D-manno-heptose 6-epimerase